MVAMYNPMEDKQLNFYQPLLSVRRCSSTSSFAEAEKKKPSNQPTSIPPLPYYKSELKSGPVTNPGVVPFNWEQIPGKPKSYAKPHSKVVDQPPPPPKFPPGRVVRLEDDKEENDSSHSEGESYLDALDMLSCSESSLLNCSLSGVSGFNDVESSGFSSGRDFMMGRFLPAAKAVASETPQLGSRKQTAAIKEELPRDVKQVVIADTKSSQYCYTPNSLPQQQEDGEEGEEEDDDHVETETVSTKLCSLVPWLCILNRFPGMRDEAQLALDSVDKVPKNHSVDKSTIYQYNKSEKVSTAIRDAIYEKRRLALYQKSDHRVKASHLKDELEKNSQQNASLYMDKSHIKEDGDTSSNLSESTTNTPPFEEVSNQEVQKENDITSSDLVAIVETNPMLTPPLPKSPTESWLSHTLPSIANKHPHSKTYLGTKNLGLKPSPAKPKWEDVVKYSTNFGVGLTPISEN